MRVTLSSGRFLSAFSAFERRALHSFRNAMVACMLTMLVESSALPF